MAGGVSRCGPACRMRSLTPSAGLAAVTELCGRLGVIEAVDAAVGPIKQRDRGFGAGELLTGIAAAQLAGEDFLTGLDRQRADVAGQQITPVPGLASTTAAGLARRITPAQWEAVEHGLAVVTSRMLSLLPAARAAALADGAGHHRPGHHRCGGLRPDTETGSPVGARQRTLAWAVARAGDVVGCPAGGPGAGIGGCSGGLAG